MFFMTMHTKTILMYFIVFAVLATLLHGCTSIGPPGSSNAEAIRLHNKSIVLLKFSGNMVGSPLKDFDFFIEMANMDKDEIPKEYTLTSFPSAEARAKGWAYLVLEPGTYYFTVVPGYKAQDAGPDKIDAETGKLTRQIFGKTTDLSTFWFRVPKDSSLLYIGSLYFSCKGQAGLLWNIDECSDVSVIDETDSASMVAIPAFRQYSLIKTAIMKRYGMPDRTNIQRLTHMGVEISGQLSPDSPDWVEMSRDRVVLPNYAFFAGGPFNVPFYLPYYPYGVFVSTPCMEIIAREFQYFDLIAHVSTALLNNRNMRKMVEQSVGPSDNPAGSSVNNGVLQAASDNNSMGILYANIQRVVLRECNENWTFCVEVEMRARLWDVMKEKYIYDSILQYTFLPKGRPRGRDRYILTVPVSSECRELDAYCSIDGPSILRAELTKASKVLTEKVIRDLGLGN
jgi:hypothetical protein